jgi:inorganic pyrophosphatase
MFMPKVFILSLFLILVPLSAFSNPVDEIDYLSSINQNYNFFIEIPTGTKEKWEVNKLSGKLEIQETKKGKRIINFIGYPGNYGFIPQTISGDGDPIDVIDLDEPGVRGSTISVKIIGGFYFKDNNETDIKLIAINPIGNFKDIKDMDELLYNHSSITAILKLWFLNYKRPGKMVFIRYINKAESDDIIEKAHLKWRQYRNLDYGLNDA